MKTLYESLQTNSLPETVDEALSRAGFKLRFLRKHHQGNVFFTCIMLGNTILYQSYKLKHAKIWLEGYLAGLEADNA